jgi:hypothetical protein
MAHREFTDSVGVAWRVWEVRPSGPVPGVHVRPELARGWLAFQCHGERRRLAPIPVGWEQVSDEELERRCQLAKSAPPPRE